MIKSIRDEFIGEELQVLRSANKSLCGITGTIVDETKNSFTVEISGEKKFKRILKNSSVFRIAGTDVDGQSIIKRPEDRIKLKIE